LGSAGTSAPATSGSSAAPGASGMIEYGAARDPAAGGRMELDLVHQLRDEAGMPALLGKGGAEAFAALDAIEARFGNKVLQDASNAAEGKTALAGPTGGFPLRIALASIRG